MNRFDFTPNRIITYPFPLTGNECREIILRIRNIDNDGNEIKFFDENGTDITKTIKDDILITNDNENIINLNCINTYILDWGVKYGDFVDFEYTIKYKGKTVITMKPQRQWIIEYNDKNVTMKKIKIQVFLETSDHDGYCTDNECEYFSKTETHYLDVPKEFEDYPLGQIDSDTYDWKSLLPNPNVEGNSGYCSLCKECEEVGLDIHDYRYTIQTVEIVSWYS